jgi:hypothetical protein
MTTETTTLEERLYDYFIQTGSLSLPGIGTFRLQRISPQTDMAEFRLKPPSFTVLYDRRVDASRRELLEYLARRMGGDEMKIMKSVNQFAHSLRSKLLLGESCDIAGIGTLYPNNGTGFRFDPQPRTYDFNPELCIQGFLRPASNFHLLVGEEWVSRDEQEKKLDSMPGSKVLRMFPPSVWVIIILSLTLILINGIARGFSPYMSRYSPFNPADPALTYSVMN